MQDRFVKIMLVVIAGLLVANLYQSDSSVALAPMPSLLGSAQAQSSNANTLPAQATPTPLAVRGVAAARDFQLVALNGMPVENMKDIVALGDGRSFIASNSKGFMVYQVVPTR